MVSLPYRLLVIKQKNVKVIINIRVALPSCLCESSFPLPPFPHPFYEILADLFQEIPRRADTEVPRSGHHGGTASSKKRASDLVSTPCRVARGHDHNGGFKRPESLGDCGDEVANIIIGDRRVQLQLEDLTTSSI